MKYFSILLFVLFSSGLFAQGKLETKTPVITLKNLMADDESTSVTYKLKNTGNQPVIINRVTPFNSNLKADWSREPLAPGKSCELHINFISSKVQEKFNYKIVVYSTAENRRLDLELSGNLIENPAKPELMYKFNMDGVKFKSNYINLNDIYTWQIIKDTVPFINTRQEAVTISSLYKSSHIQVEVSPEKIEPGKKGMLIITYDAQKKNDYGYSYESLILSFNNEKNYNRRLSLNARLVEDFSRLSAKELANAPVANFDKKEVHFGQIAPGEKANCDFTLTNTGKNRLIIRKTKASCGCTAVTLGQREVEPGQSTVIRATFDSKGKSGRQYKTITVITNDPKNPEISLNINGEIKKS